MISISICMIVKNEERILERCLNSVADLAEEIIIVDTGSTDKTKEIAAKYTDKIYDFTWIDDFSAARNFAFSKATKDYIYSVDADEVLDEENRIKFKTLKEVLPDEVDMVQMYYANQMAYDTVYNFDKEYRPKLFKRLRTFQWIEPIHETIALYPNIYDSDIEICHLPEQAHGSRDLKNFEKQIRMGRKLSAHLHNMYARELLMAGEKENLLTAEEYFTNSIQEIGRTEKELQEAFCILAEIASIKQDAHMLLGTVAKAMSLSQCSEICYSLGKYYESLKDYPEAIMWYYNAAYETEPILVKKRGEIHPLQGIIRCYESLGDTENVNLWQEKLAEMETQ